MWKTFDFLVHPSCLVATDPQFKAVELICDMVKAAGVEIVEVDKKSFQDVMGPVYDKFASTPDMKRLVKAVQDTK